MRKHKLFIVVLIATISIIRFGIGNQILAQTGNNTAISELNPFLGTWDITTSEGRAGWLSVTLKEGYSLFFGQSATPPPPFYYLDSELLYAGSHVHPMAWTYMDGDALVVYRTRSVSRRDESGKVALTQTAMERYTFRVDGDKLTGTKDIPDVNYTTVSPEAFTGVRSPVLPPAPDLSMVRFGEPVVLFSGNNLDGWKMANSDDTNGWRVEDGVLINEVVRGSGTPGYGNLMSLEDYGDVNLKCEVMVPERGNSGIFLRGMYEIQLEDSYNNDELSNLGMGALYNRITPTVKAELPAGEWQTLDITLVDRHLTVVLNGTTIIDNQPVPGCTTGAFRSDQTLPGPIVIQGENTSVSFRNMVLRPVIK